MLYYFCFKPQNNMKIQKLWLITWLHSFMLNMYSCWKKLMLCICFIYVNSFSVESKELILQTRDDTLNNIIKDWWSQQQVSSNLFLFIMVWEVHFGYNQQQLSQCDVFWNILKLLWKRSVYIPSGINFMQYETTQ